MIIDVILMFRMLLIHANTLLFDVYSIESYIVVFVSRKVNKTL